MGFINSKEQSQKKIRNSSGLVKMVKPGEIGMIVGKVRNDVLSKFEGYTREFCLNIPLTLRRPGRQAWRPGLFYGAHRPHLQVITKGGEKCFPLKFNFFFQNKSLKSPRTAKRAPGGYFSERAPEG